MKVDIRQEAINYASKNVGYPSFEANLVEEAYFKGYKAALRREKDKIKKNEKDISNNKSR